MRLLLFLLLLFATYPAYGEIYAWKQGGTTHYTNQRDTIPPRYRNRAKVLALPGEEKGAQGTPGNQGAAAPALSTLPLPPPPPPPAAGLQQAPARQDGARKSRRGSREPEEE